MERPPPASPAPTPSGVLHRPRMGGSRGRRRAVALDELAADAPPALSRTSCGLITSACRPSRRGARRSSPPAARRSRPRPARRRRRPTDVTVGPNCARSAAHGPRRHPHDGPHRRPALLDRRHDGLPRRGQVEVGGRHDRIARSTVDRAHPADAERAQAGGSVSATRYQTEPFSTRPRGCTVRSVSVRVPVGVAKPHLDAVDDGLLQHVEVMRPRRRRAAPAGRVEHDGRRRRLGVGAERLGQRLDQLAQGGLGLRRRRRRRSGDHEQRAGPRRP